MDLATSTSATLANLPFDNITLLGFYAVTAGYCIFSAILYYHWNAYGTDARVTKLTLYSYAGTTIPLLLIMGLMALII